MSAFDPLRTFGSGCLLSRPETQLDPDRVASTFPRGGAPGDFVPPTSLQTCSGSVAMLR